MSTRDFVSRLARSMFHVFPDPVRVEKKSERRDILGRVSQRTAKVGRSLRRAMRN